MLSEDEFSLLFLEVWQERVLCGTDRPIIDHELKRNIGLLNDLKLGIGKNSLGGRLGKVRSLERLILDGLTPNKKITASI